MGMATWDESAARDRLEDALAKDFTYADRVNYGTQDARNQALREEFEQERRTAAKTKRVGDRADKYRRYTGDTYAEQRGKNRAEGSVHVTHELDLPDLSSHPHAIRAQAESLDVSNFTDK